MKNKLDKNVIFEILFVFVFVIGLLYLTKLSIDVLIKVFLNQLEAVFLALGGVIFFISITLFFIYLGLAIIFETLLKKKENTIIKKSDNFIFFLLLKVVLFSLGVMTFGAIIYLLF